MNPLHRYSEPYNATGGMAAAGVLNQLGRPNIEPLEVLVREAVQNCWDARSPTEPGIRVDIGRGRLGLDVIGEVIERVLVDPPPALPLGDVLDAGVEILYFADYGTMGLGGPTRADQADDAELKDFVDFVRNIGQPPDKEFGGGSYGFGKAAFYIASRARTILVDTVWERDDGALERRFIASALGEQYAEDGQPFTGRHWWGRMLDGVPEPLIDDDARAAASLFGMPDRSGPDGRGTTVAIVAPRIGVVGGDGADATMEFITEALLWNFWPRITSAPGGKHSTMRFELHDDGRRLYVPDPRTHPRLRGFVEAMDHLRGEEDASDAEEADPLVIDSQIRCLRPIKDLGRLVIQRGPTAPVSGRERAVPCGAKETEGGLHHVALMRNAELVVRYLPGPESVTGRFGYSGAFRCALDVDQTFRRAEPPTHDDWSPRSLERGHDRTFVKVALQRIERICRQAAGFDTTVSAPGTDGNVPLGEFADALATLMPSVEGPGARSEYRRSSGAPRRRRNAPGSRSAAAADGVWVQGEPAAPEQTAKPAASETGPGVGPSLVAAVQQPARAAPQVRTAGEPRLALAEGGTAVVHYPFELRGRGNGVRLTATVEVMTNDGAQIEGEPPLGLDPPAVWGWIDPSHDSHVGQSVDVPAEGTDGCWCVTVPVTEDAMIRVDVHAHAL